MAAVITSITGLQNLPNLQNFNADYNSLTTVNLSGLANLLFVDISDNDVLGSGDPSLTSVNLSGCTALQTLRLDDSDFSAGIPNLAGLTSLTNLDMDQCSISGVVDLTGLSALEELDFYGNTALTSIIIDDAQPIQYFYASSCALTETAVDNILIELSDNGIAGGNVELDGGTNASPSATGLAAKLALEADGWSVDVNEPTTTTTTSSSTSTTTSTSTSTTTTTSTSTSTTTTTTTIAPTTTTTTTAPPSYYSYDVSNVFGGSGPGDACLAEQTIVLYANTNDPLGSLVGNFLYTDTALTTKFTGNPPGVGGYYRYGLTGDPITYRSDFAIDGTINNITEC